MSGLWADQLRAQDRSRKRKERDRKRGKRRKIVNDVRHPVKAAWRRWGLW